LFTAKKTDPVREPQPRLTHNSLHFSISALWCSAVIQEQSRLIEIIPVEVQGYYRRLLVGLL